MSDTSTPLAGLPGADRRLLDRPPLELAIAEVRLISPVSSIDDEAGLSIRDSLAKKGWDFPTLNVARAQHVAFTMAASGASQQVSEVASGWQLVSGDGSTHVTVMPESLVVQTMAYHRWSISLRPLLEAALEALGEALAPTLHQRIGLRYVNRFTDPDASSPASWSGRVSPELLGATCHPLLGKHVRSAQEQVELALEETSGALLRHGPFVDPGVANATSYLLDIDVFDGQTARFDVVAIVERAEALNRTAAVLFQAVLTPEFLHELQGIQDEADEGSLVASATATGGREAL